ncbi:hypothetical protein RJ639_044031 [Escallonia herrerae]|uniref:Uncharacterized protein n=1 Tax=Escallonia herrerae TaxID=1293975 RepID=A0AA88WDP7_9ASTE|nr:hypothetical protein RJ639_044031 [Escallonia herrerae]
MLVKGGGFPGSPSWNPGKCNGGDTRRSVQESAACWSDTFYCVMAPHSRDPEELPDACSVCVDFQSTLPRRRRNHRERHESIFNLVTNDNFKSINHMILASNKGPRISFARAFRTHFQEGITPKPYGPIEELPEKIIR